jgi:hypothetical protein
MTTSLIYLKDIFENQKEEEISSVIYATEAHNLMKAMAGNP